MKNYIGIPYSEAKYELKNSLSEIIKNYLNERHQNTPGIDLKSFNFINSRCFLVPFTSLAYSVECDYQYESYDLREEPYTSYETYYEQVPYTTYQDGRPYTDYRREERTRPVTAYREVEYNNRVIKDSAILEIETDMRFGNSFTKIINDARLKNLGGEKLEKIFKKVGELYMIAYSQENYYEGNEEGEDNDEIKNFSSQFITSNNKDIKTFITLPDYNFLHENIDDDERTNKTFEELKKEPNRVGENQTNYSYNGTEKIISATTRYVPIYLHEFSMNISSKNEEKSVFIIEKISAEDKLNEFVIDDFDADYLSSNHEGARLDYCLPFFIFFFSSIVPIVYKFKDISQSKDYLAISIISLILGNIFFYLCWDRQANDEKIKMSNQNNKIVDLKLKIIKDVSIPKIKKGELNLVNDEFILDTYRKKVINIFNKKISLTFLLSYLALSIPILDIIFSSYALDTLIILKVLGIWISIISSYLLLKK